MADVSPFECPICMLNYAEEEPTTFPCGHSCCLTDAKQLNKCHICRTEIPTERLVTNYTLRDAAILNQTREKDRARKDDADEIDGSGAVDKEDILKNNKKPNKKKKKKKLNKKHKNSSSVTIEVLVEEPSVPDVVTDTRHLEKNLLVGGRDDSEDDDDEDDDDNDETVMATGVSLTTADTRINIDSLQPYVIRLYPSSDPSDKEMTTNLEKVFRKSVTLGETFDHIKVFGDTNQSKPWSIIVHTICGMYAKKNITRFIVQDSQQTQGIVFDILSVKVCPHHLLSKALLRHKKDKNLEVEDVDVYPLIHVRYHYATEESWDPAIGQELQDGANRKLLNFSVETSKAVIQKAWVELRAMQALIAPEYARKFAADNKALFSPSMLVPSMPEDFVKLEEGLCSLAGCNKIGFAVCSKCKSAQYCSREHQVEHWKKLHKKVCGKSHTELSSYVSEERSVVLSLSMSPDHGFGENAIQTNINYLDGKMSVLQMGDTSRNVHGDSKFLVKVQLGIDWSPNNIRATKDAPMVIYDERRTLRADIDTTQDPLFSVVFDAVNRGGIAQPDRTATNEPIKAYMFAKREGNNLRLFIDHFVPMPGW